MIQIPLEDAYAEACRALGESIVRERLLTRELAQQEAAQLAPVQGAPNTFQPVDPVPSAD